MRTQFRGKRLLAMIVAICMVAVMIPAIAFAADATELSFGKKSSSFMLEKSESYAGSVDLSKKITVTPNDGTVDITWESADAAVATVDTEGNVVAAGPGETNIIAKSGELSATCKITVWNGDEALKVYNGNALVKTYTSDAFAALEDVANTDYSAFNSKASETKTFSMEKGVSVDKLLKDAGINLDSVKDDQIINFKSLDGAETNYTLEELMGNRYYYPNYGRVLNGIAVTNLSKANAVRVPAAIASKSDNDAGRLAFGQAEPNEQNLTFFNKYISTGGTITVTDKTADTLKNDITANVASGKTIVPGTEITLNSSTIDDNPIYFTDNGTTPTAASAIYNYNNYDSPTVNQKIYAPATEGTFTVKALIKQYGFKDSAVKTFKYSVKKLPAVNKTYTVGNCKYKVTKSATSGGTATLTGLKKKTYTKATVPTTVKINGYTFNVTAIGNKAFYKNSKLKTVTIKTKTLSKVGSKAFTGVNKKITVKIPKTKYNAYKKMLKGKGLPKTVKYSKF